MAFAPVIAKHIPDDMVPQHIRRMWFVVSLFGMIKPGMHWREFPFFTVA